MNLYLRHDCYRKGCSRNRSDFTLFLSRRHVPQFDGHAFCGEACLRAYVQEDLARRWQELQGDRLRRIPRPKLGSILMQTALITREQLEQAVGLQKLNRQGRLGEWLVRLGFVEERQITVALAKQFGLPLIDLKNSAPQPDAVAMIPARVARYSSLIPVSYDDDRRSLRIAVSGPVNFYLQQALHGMIGKGISTFIGDASAIQALLTGWYDRDDVLDARGFRSLEELLDLFGDTVSVAMNRKATNIQAELLEKYFWVRLDTGATSKHLVYPSIAMPALAEDTHLDSL